MLWSQSLTDVILDVGYPQGHDDTWVALWFLCCHLVRVHHVGYPRTNPISGRRDQARVAISAEELFMGIRCERSLLRVPMGSVDVLGPNNYS